MTTKKNTPIYDRLGKRIGPVTFANHLIAIVETDFDSPTACAKKLKMSP
jgi:hypothetical protein